LRYGQLPEHVADLYLPSAVEPAPLLLLIHGGFWKVEWDRMHVRPMARALADEGYLVASIEYRRVGSGVGSGVGGGGGGWPTSLDDVARAVAELPGTVAQRFPTRVDPDVVVTIGHSAGGHLALWAALTAPNVTGAVSLAGVIDLRSAYLIGSGAGAVARFMGGGPDEVPERYAVADPARLAAPTVPVALLHGEDDAVLPVAISLGYGERVGIPVSELADTGHFDLIEPDSAAWPAVLRAIADVLAR
jgi:acetyl esterase/lipase